MLRVTKTENGAVRGFPGTDARITVFKGIPFADNTSGDNRWRAPQPAENWEGVRDCYEFGPITMQKIPGQNPDAFYSKEWHVDPEVPMGEDSLRVNIWTPAKSADEKLPVMVWIFGGGLSEGYAHEMEFDGERIASRGVILVSVAYRLNVFGYLAHPELTAENPDAPTNFGFLDQKAGLEWVQRNIANFGGDPDNVTIFGQSAGGLSILAHICSAQSSKLFNRGIVQSVGGLSAYYPKAMFPVGRSLEEAEQDGVKFFEALGVKTIEEARKLDAHFIEDKFNELGLMFNYVIDGKFLEKSVDEYALTDTMNRVPFMIGSTGDEFPLRPDKDPVEWMKEIYMDKADEVLKLYAENNIPVDEKLSISKNRGSAHLLCEVAAAHGYDIHYYTFDPEIPGDDAGSFHSSDLWFEFETLMKCWRPFDGHHYDLARKMCNYWTNFAKTGDPNGNDSDGTPMPKWEKYTLESPKGINFFDDIAMEETGRDPIEQYVLELNLDKLGYKK